MALSLSKSAKHWIAGIVGALVLLCQSGAVVNAAESGPGPMVSRATLPLRWTIMLLVAALGFMQASVGYATFLDQGTVASSGATRNVCCEMGMGQPDGCVTPDVAGLPAPCASSYCMEPRRAVTTDVAAPATGFTAVAPEFRRFRYREKPPMLAAAPPASSKTPLIYHLQRLLN